MPKFSYAIAAALVLWSRVADARPPPVVVELEQDAPEIDGTELRDAVARELDAPVVSEAGPEIEAVRTVVRIDRARGELQVEREGRPGEAIVRRVPLPAEPSEALRTAVFLIGNLARDEAGTLIHDLHAREATAPAAPEPAPIPSAASSPPLPSAIATTARKRLWIGASVEGDVAFVSSANDVCLLTSTGVSLNAYRCVDGSSPFPSNITIDNEIRKGVDDQVQSGLSLANARFLVAVDAALDDHWLLGGRLGVATATYPIHGETDVGAFGKLHVEARVTYVIGEHPLATAALAPVLVLGTGLAEHSTAVSVKVALTSPTATSTGSVSAWRVAGPGFVSTGIGLRWTVPPGFALSFLPKATLAFGSGSPMALLSPEIVGQVGF
jgi:hypothetical protein